MPSFSDLDDLVIVNILSYCKASQLLNLSILKVSVKEVSRSDVLWEPHLERQKKKYPLALPHIVNDSPLPSTRLSLSCLRKISVKALKELASLFKIPPMEITACSEKSEICKLIYDKQLRLLRREFESYTPNSYEKEWQNHLFASFWCFLKDLRRNHIFEHELIDREWGMYWRPREEGALPQFHTAVTFHSDGSFSGEDAQLTQRNEGKTWRRGSQGVTVDPYPMLEATRTPTGGWRLTNPYVIMLSDVNHASGFESHYPK